MRIPDLMVQQMLLDAGKIKQDQVQNLLEKVKSSKKALQDIVIRDGLVTEAELTEMFAHAINTPFITINPKEVDDETLRLIPEKIARKYNVVLLKKPDGSRILAMEDPDDVQALDFIQKQVGSDIAINIATRQDILTALDQYRGNIGTEITEVISDTSEDIPESDDITEADVAENSPVAQTVNLILEYAIKSNASDIHIEARESLVQIRYRIDGVLREVNQLPKKIHAALVSRIKILSNLKIDERRAPQDGRFKLNLGGRIFAFRVSTLPTVDGEKVVLRILDESSKAASLDELGFWGTALEQINQAIVQPHGMLLVTGPTGSGKSTTLHSVLNILNKPDVNISTVEDPVEYRLAGVNQTQVNPKAEMTFANGLRALLRQDPNIIMVGEIRDSETAGLGVQAALTGHLVFSTLHTNNAATCLPRLLDMGIEPFLIASTVRAVVGQRLVRKINLDQAEQHQPSANEFKQVEKAFGIKTQDDWKNVMRAANQAQEHFGVERTDGPIFYRPKPVDGKSQNKEQEYKGRMGIYEVLSNTEQIQKLIMANSTSDEIQMKAIEEGMLTMQLDGLIKAMCGMTSIAEILRVTRE